MLLNKADLMTPRQVARTLGISRSEVYRLIRLGVLDSYRTHRRGRILLLRKDIEPLLDGGVRVVKG